MKFSEFFEIDRTDKDDWFDPILTIDTKLFIDPFLIYASESGLFKGSHEEIINFFNDAFSYIAKSEGNSRSTPWIKGKNLLIFPEVEEICLGYVSEGTGGAGSGGGFSKVIAEALWEAVIAGKTNLTHFEEVGIFREGIGADRISDITANIIRHKLATYTKQVCERHGIPTRSGIFLRGRYERRYARWLPLKYDLPYNKYSNKPILLVPEIFLRPLPTISAHEFWDYCYTNENETLRIDFGEDISRNVDKETIVEFAKAHPDLRAKYIDAVSKDDPDPYDFNTDTKGLIGWYDASRSYCKENPISVRITSEAAFLTAIKKMLKEFSNYIENNAGWKLLWNDGGTPRSEEAAQFLFLGIIKHYCKANNIDISRETNIGRGPVDFKVSVGYEMRALLELKLAKNSKFWNGVTRQLPKYQEAEDVSIGFFIVILYTDNDEKRIKGIRDKIAIVNNATGYNISPIIIDARRNPPSASNL